MNTASDLQHKEVATQSPVWKTLMRGVAPRAVMAAAMGLLMELPAPVVDAHGGDASLVHACVKKVGGQTRIVGPSVICAANETALDWSITGPTGATGATGPAGPQGPAGPAGSAFPTSCPPDSVLSGTTCIDTYETSVWETTNPDLIASIRDGTVTLADLTAAGAVQRGVTIPDYGAGCPVTGNDCVDFYAVSVPGVTPSNFLSWFQAAAAARNSGKRLPSNAEWQAAALGTPDPGTDDEATDCNIDGPPFAVTPTGSRNNCVSDVGAFDMVGNLPEWVADWVPLSTACIPIVGAGDLNCLAGASTTSGPGALVRGGDFINFGAGVFAVEGRNTPSNPVSGFRAAR